MVQRLTLKSLNHQSYRRAQSSFWKFFFLMNLSCHLALYCWMISICWITSNHFSSNSLKRFNCCFYVVVRSKFTCNVVLNVLISNSMGNKWFLPYNSSYGENFVVFLHVVLYAHNTSGSLLVQSLQWLATVLVRIPSITLLVLSNYPLACGW